MSNFFTEVLPKVEKQMKAETCAKMRDKCISTWGLENKPWGDLKTCYKEENGQIKNSFGQPSGFSLEEYKQCQSYLDMAATEFKEGFTSVDNAASLLTLNVPDGSSAISAIDEEIEEVNDADSGSEGENRGKVQEILDRYDAVKENRDKAQKMLEEMESVNTDLQLQTNSMIYTTLFATALGTCVLYYFARQL